ncbi:helix-turn-helix transcriptional regulator [Ruminococcus sp. XPD3002]|uniref:helix-turn-helix domain-containing protein n=1 Tax=Ruminococcus sp. XPD3002 TaxID=1452269 RepID=UPI0009185D00|nr:Helix-turn-helix [Ruminococcus flavefaciens]
MNNVLKELRQKKGCKHKEMSEALGVSVSQLSDYENGRKKLGMSMAIKLADFYNVSLDYIMGRETDIDNRSDIERLTAENNLTGADEEFLKQNQDQLVQLLKKKQDEIDELKRENLELRAKYE